MVSIFFFYFFVMLTETCYRDSGEVDKLDISNIFNLNLNNKLEGGGRIHVKTFFDPTVTSDFTTIGKGDYISPTLQHKEKKKSVFFCFDAPFCLLHFPCIFWRLPTWSWTNWPKHSLDFCLSSAKQWSFWRSWVLCIFRFIVENGSIFLFSRWFQCRRASFRPRYTRTAFLISIIRTVQCYFAAYSYNNFTRGVIKFIFNKCFTIGSKCLRSGGNY